MPGPPQRSLAFELIVLVGVVVSLVASAELLRPVVGNDSPWLGLLWMFYFLAICKFAEPFIDLPLPSGLREVRAWEPSRRGYARFGVQGFGRLLARTPLRLLNTSVYLSGRQRDLERLQADAAYSEAAHFWALLLFLPYLAWLFATGNTAFGALFALAQLPVNVYPILHLRLLRGRLQRVRQHRAGRVGLSGMDRESLA